MFHLNTSVHAFIKILDNTFKKKKYYENNELLFTQADTIVSQIKYIQGKYY